MITIIGTGSWGTALGVVLASNGHDLSFCGLEQDVLNDLVQNNCNSKYLGDIKLFHQNKDLNKQVYISATADLSQALNSNSSSIENIEAIVIATPSEVFANIIKQIKFNLTSDNNYSFKNKKIPIIIATKGLSEDENNKPLWLGKIIEQQLGDDYPYSIISGPSFAKEVAAMQPTAIVMASKNIDIAKQCAQFFHNNWFRVYTRTDVISVQLGGAVKNIIAFAVGCAEGYGFGCNARAALITRGLHEMIELGATLAQDKSFGIEKDTLMGLTGLGDLVLTATDHQSRNTRFGYYIGQGLTKDAAVKKVEQYVACIESTKLIYNLAKDYKVDMPLTEQAYNIIYKNITVEDAIKSLSNRPGKSE